MNNKEIIEELNQIFEKYKGYLINVYKNSESLNYKIILVNSVLNRSVAIIEAYKKILDTSNIIILNSLVRMQIDNCIFIYGVFLLCKNGYSIDEISEEIIKNNKKLSQYKINKEKMTDSYIISKINEEYKNKFEEMYKFYCRFIHFSDSALLSSMSVYDNNILELELVTDYSRFTKHINENANSFINLSKFLLIMLDKKWENIKSHKKI